MGGVSSVRSQALTFISECEAARDALIEIRNPGDQNQSKEALEVANSEHDKRAVEPAGAPRVETAKDISKALWSAIREREASLPPGQEVIVIPTAPPFVRIALNRTQDDNPRRIVLIGIDDDRGEVRLDLPVAGFGYLLATRPISGEYKPDPPITGFGPIPA